MIVVRSTCYRYPMLFILYNTNTCVVWAPTTAWCVTAPVQVSSRRRGPQCNILAKRCNTFMRIKVFKLDSGGKTYRY